MAEPDKHASATSTPNRTAPRAAPTAESVSTRLRTFARAFDERLAGYLTPAGDVPEELVAAVRYACLAPGKRVRPYVVVRCCELVGGDLETAWPVAAAVECIHAFSLIHDDLPAMDDDAFRRGRPTCHKKFGEATAILAGDTLSVLAFELLAREATDPTLSRRLVAELAGATGWDGMIGGQAADLVGQRQRPSEAHVGFIHDRKTARLFRAACRMGAICASADAERIVALGQYGHALGRAFQIADDLLDLTADAATLGKEVRKDAVAQKQTLPGCVGMEESRTAASEFVQTAIAALGQFGAQADDLRLLARYVVSRNY